MCSPAGESKEWVSHGPVAGNDMTGIVPDCGSPRDRPAAVPTLVLGRPPINPG